MWKEVPHLWRDLHTSFKDKRSKVKVTRLINADTHRAPYRTARPTNFELTVRMANDDPHQPQAPWPPRSKVKVTWSIWAVLAQCCTFIIRGRRGHTVSAEPGGHTSCLIYRIQAEYIILFNALAELRFADKTSAVRLRTPRERPPPRR